MYLTGFDRIPFKTMFSSQHCALVVIDVQGRLTQTMDNKDQLLSNIQRLLKAALLLDIPIVVTEQAPDKIGSTISEISQYLKEVPIKKNSFSCCGEKAFLEKIAGLNTRQIIVCGIETHVCVFQTVCDLKQHHYDVQVVVDAVSSRSHQNKQLGLNRIESVGGVLTCGEMIICELLKTADHPKFRDIMKLIK